MKKLLIIFALPVILFSCNNPEGEDHEGHDHGDTASVENTQEADTMNFGEMVTKEGAITVDELISEMEDHDSIHAKIRGEVVSVCQKKGCWMKIRAGENEDIMITFKDYGFFVPKDLSGEVVMQGKAYYDTLDVKTLRHYAEDAGKTEEEINSITEPETRLSFLAEGVTRL